ncbi:unnamed protein product [Effrenium voratum]|uniref:Uncharacterized protein n=1 Tax=Effrenium voratum TaxID=2562239 RepID=A0AA36JN36_9DINO|nr:unnamed protein product [Effrenium voratum]
MAEAQEKEIRQVKLPVGWEGLSLKSHDGRLLVSEVPKACFSSKSFESSGAKPQELRTLTRVERQVDGVFEGDEILTVNGEPPPSAAPGESLPRDESIRCEFGIHSWRG